MARSHGKSSNRSWRSSDQRPQRRDSRFSRGNSLGDRRNAVLDGGRLIAALTEMATSATASQVAERTGDDARAVGSALKRLVELGQVLEIRPGRYQANGTGGEHAAVLVELGDGIHARLADGVMRPVNPAYLIGAKPGDVVQIATGEDDLALVTRILRRAGREVVGTLQFDPGATWLVCDNRREGRLAVKGLFEGFDEGYQTGKRVVGTIAVDDDGQASVRLTRFLAPQTPEIADFAYVCSAHDLPGEFPAEVEAAAKAFPARFPKGKRVDLTKRLVFTIDPATAKDFDDAISLERDERGRWVLGVHIADVCHYVREGTPIDAEASSRGTSIYLINRVIPMLPEALSNGLCSLVPGKPRYCLSAFLTLDQRHEIAHVELAESIIHSRHRLTYEEALAVLEDRDHEGAWPGDLRTVLKQVSHIAQVLRKKREAAGAVNLFSVEHRFRLDVEGNPIAAEREGSDISHQLIEECMLLANRAVAQWLTEHDLPCVFRLHEAPDEERLQQFAMVLEGYGRDAQGLENRFRLQQILRNLEQEPPAARLVLNHLLLRCFKKAVYGIEDSGHYALAFNHYCHFTSPIRRYPDLLVHRLVKKALHLPDYKAVESRAGYLDALAKQSSFLEQRAELAERDLHARKSCRYLSARIGEEFPGVVLGAMGGGLFVQLLETGMEGVLPVRELDDDYYEYDPARLALVGRNSGRVIGPGEEMDVVINHVDIERADVSLGLVKGHVHGREAEAQPRSRGGRPDRRQEREREDQRAYKRRDDRDRDRPRRPAPEPEAEPEPAPEPPVAPAPARKDAAKPDTRRLPRKLLDRWAREDSKTPAKTKGKRTGKALRKPSRRG